MSTLIASIDAEYRRYKALAEAAVAQVTDEELSRPGPAGSNSIATIMWHIAGNLASRFTEFRTTDGEKPWRNRDEEFEDRVVTRAELLGRWESGWAPLFRTLAALTDDDLAATVAIRGQSLAIHEALHRSVAHTSYHVGQIVYIAKALRGGSWQTLSIPKGGSRAYNERGTPERAGDHASALRHRAGR